jgi:2-oxoisovalerate dehydrogenase E1 component alpha subunit
MLFTHAVDECAERLHRQGLIGFVTSCRGHEAAQVGSAICIEVGKDFTLPYYRDLGVVLTIGMTAYEVFRTYLQAYSQQSVGDGNGVQVPHSGAERENAMHHWGYHKHNMITGPAPVATQILHAAGIAFASKLRKAGAVTVAYCGDGATAEADFLEGITFAAQHQLPVVFICEQDCPQTDLGSYAPASSLQSLSLPSGLKHLSLDGSDVIAVYTSMQAAMQYARDGHGPVLLGMHITRPVQSQPEEPLDALPTKEYKGDPLLCCQRLLEETGAWDEQWATQLHARVSHEVEQAMQDALRDCT